MKRALLASLAILSLASSFLAQKRATIFGDAFTGEVVSSNENTREITITYTDKDKNKTETFVGVLKPGYQLTLRDGTRRELQMAELKAGLRIRVFYNETSDHLAGKKVKIKRINRIQFLGRDEYTILREALGVAPSLPVRLALSDELPATDPLKLYVAIHEPSINDRVIAWVDRWNKEQAAKYGRIEIAQELAQADVAAVFFWGADESIFSEPVLFRESDGNSFVLYKATSQLVTKDDAGLRVLWQNSTLAGRKTLEGGPLEREIEKRMRSRGKK
ncbi:MAG TPA: hypothetical protein VJ749_11810 [Pyrinomonadaceae bacterium]|nr:hypothetical protein [Pyrinomonadaceae bacterium]